MKKVLITGGNGLLGSNVARELFRQGYEIKLIIRPQADTSMIADIPCEIFHGDISKSTDVQMAVQGCDFVVHTASVTAQWGISFKEYEQVNITGTKNIADACLLHRIKKFVYVSTANTMGPGSKKKPATELSSFKFIHTNSHYINTKYVAQQYVLEQVIKKGLPAVIINPTFMIGRYDTKPSSGKIILYGINKRIIFCPPGGKNFVHVEDVCTAIANALGRGKTGECYLVAAENLSYRDFFKLLNAVSGQKTLLVKVPQIVLKAAGLLGSIAGVFSKTPLKLNYSSANMLCLHNYYSGKKSARELGIQYTAIQNAISSAVKWFTENKYC